MARYNDSVHFDSVVILESLPIGEKKTGRDLYDQVLQPIEATEANLRVSYNSVSSRAEFFAVLGAVEKEFIDLGRSPILHLEAHGSEGGLRLGNGEVVEWEELRERLTAMNHATGMNLFLVMAMCRGWHIARLLHPLSQAPVWGLVGPAVDVWDYDLGQATKAFYEEFFSSLIGTRALDAMNQGLPFEDWTYILETAEVMFCKIMASYVRDQGSPEARKERENQIVEEIVRRRDYDIRAAPEARLLAAQILRDHQRAFQYYRQTFLMIDHFPELDQRFKISFEDCMEAHGLAEQD